MRSTTQAVRPAFAVLLVLQLPPLAAPLARAAQRQTAGPGRVVVDVSGVEMFLEVTAILEQDNEPTPAQWDRLFSTPGYAVLVEREFSRDFFADRFRMAFMPSKKADLEAHSFVCSRNVTWSEGVAHRHFEAHSKGDRVLL